MAHIAMNPVTVDFLANVCRVAPEKIAVCDLIELARMVRNGDLVHIDAIPAVLEAQRQAQMHDDFVDACRTADAAWEYAASRGEL
jgi:hypothetical protein